VNIVIATHNPHKLDEIRALAGADLTVLSLLDIGFVDDPPETGDTFLANALQKARYVQARIGGIVAADDSGLEVDALGGAPGVHSKRFTPEQTAEANNQQLLSLLGARPERAARFRCALAVVGPTGEATAEGTCEGSIALEPRGVQGFGYDPLFLPLEAPGRTMAELTAAEKNAISHRGRAFAALHRLARSVSAA
jgi:XTP/dITP diphosphohydrolase